MTTTKRRVVRRKKRRAILQRASMFNTDKVYAITEDGRVLVSQAKQVQRILCGLGPGLHELDPSEEWRPVTPSRVPLTIRDTVDERARLFAGLEEMGGGWLR